MNTDYILKLLEKLCLADGTSGDEGTAAKIAAEELEKYMSVTRDKLGNVIGRQEGEGTHFLLDAHIDRIGLVVTAITDEGFVKVGACGGVDTRTLDAAEVVIYGRKPIYGVVSAIPPHLTKSGENKASDVSDIAIDIGMDKETVILRMKTQLPHKFKASEGAPIANAVIFDIDNTSKKCTSVKRFNF